MSDSANIFSVTEADFESKVIEASRTVPVLVDFWADWCGPCHALMPVLAQLVDEYDGKFLLAKVNTDEQQALAMQFAVRSLPTVKVFKDGQVVDEFMGAQPAAMIRPILERHLIRASDLIREQALARHRDGDSDAAVELLQQAADQDPANHKVAIELAGMLALTGQSDRAEAILRGMPIEVRDSDDVKSLLGRLRFARIAEEVPTEAELQGRIEADAGDLDARYKLAAGKISAGDYEPGMEQLLEIMRRDRTFEEDAGRDGLLAVFEILGGGGDLVMRYRRQLANLMH